VIPKKIKIKIKIESDIVKKFINKKKEKVSDYTASY